MGRVNDYVRICVVSLPYDAWAILPCIRVGSWISKIEVKSEFSGPIGVRSMNRMSSKYIQMYGLGIALNPIDGLSAAIADWGKRRASEFARAARHLVYQSAVVEDIDSLGLSSVDYSGRQT